ncbi:hypothetical protein [Pseudocolwellia sp. HL-MZ7]
MKKLTYILKPSVKKSVKAKANKKVHPDIIYLDQSFKGYRSEVNN